MNLAIFLLSATLAHPMSGIALKTSICELDADPQRFNRKVVELQADYKSDGMEFWILTDPKCPLKGGILPSGQVHDAPVGNALLEALRHGCPGTRDKRVTANWTGEFHWEPKNGPGSGRVYRWLDVQKIENLQVVPLPGVLACQ